MLIVFVTTPNLEEAERLARSIVESRLAACVQVLPEMTSVYLWNGEVRKDREHLLLIKTLEAMFPILEEFIKSNHSYEIPEIVAVRSEHVSEDYLKWMKHNGQWTMDSGQCVD